ncbi:dihydrofolate reductase [Falsiporphyromonas endometrii]|uniref:Dihydrofolate reductase n=1 Tax=Falsiporphyromonas endometrii TaxID=1387297 RepID=A0ABV9K8Z0_9PORP
MKVSIIVAVSDNFAIGKDNDMPWHLPRDLKHFKEVTSHHTVVMGKNTFLSLPKGALPNRRNLVISSTLRSEDIHPAEVVSSLDLALDMARKFGEDELFIMGGGQLYAKAIDLADRMYITHIHSEIADADTFFPRFDTSKWKLVGKTEFQRDEKNPFDLTFCTYERI